MGDMVKSVPYNNPSLIPLGDYNIEIRKPSTIELNNKGSLGEGKGNYSIIQKYDIDGREIIFVDMVTLKKVLDMSKKYPKMKDDEVMTICQLQLSDSVLDVRGDIVKVTKNPQKHVASAGERKRSK